MTALWYGVAKGVLWLFFRVGFGLTVRGHAHIPTHGAFIVAANHVSLLDPPLIGVACPRRLRFLARATLYVTPWLGTFLRSVGAIPLERDGSDIRALRAALAELRQGVPVAIFPEGGRSMSGGLGVARRGVGFLASAGRVPIIPALVTGTFAALPPHARRLHRAKIHVAFGPAIQYNQNFGQPISAQEAGGAMVGGEGGRARVQRAQQEQLAGAVTQAWQRLAECTHEGTVRTAR